MKKRRQNYQNHFDAGFNSSTKMNLVRTFGTNFFVVKIKV